ncbi:hypothetical protein OsI_33072 [Oryza sativa Indica Group]|uniref:FAD-binding FR-type domain-containing protein n=1 Tax=Oryza sativa subsp. indica TaxID=39946 RepID=A2Z5Z8_ORYSI|nr:hypothetical protein OsI_33072 [Oryza sativa Indica Group]
MNFDRYSTPTRPRRSSTPTASASSSPPAPGTASNLSQLAPIREAIKAPAPIALSSPGDKVPCQLIDKKELSRDVRLFRFALPSFDQVLGLPVGKHIFICASIEGKLCMRAYTPTSMVDEVGHFDLFIKVYFKNEHPKFPNGGLMTQYLDLLPVGAYIDVKGPLDHVEYTGRGSDFLVQEQEDQGGNQTIRMQPQQGRFFGREEMSNGVEYDAAYAATVAAVAYAIAAKEEEKQATEETRVKKKLTSEKKPVANDEPSTTPTLKLPPNRQGILKRPRQTEGSRITRRFSGKEIVPDEEDDGLEANVSVRRPVRTAQKIPEGGISGQNMVGKVLDSVPSIRKAPSFAKPLPEKKGSMKFEQEQAIPTVPPNVRPTALFPREKKESKKFDQDQAIPRVPPDVRPTASFSREKKESKKFEQDKANQMPSLASAPTSSYSSEAEAMADTWEKEKMAKIKKQYNMTMDTIVEWEAEKKAKAKRQMELKEGDNSERKREKALEEYNDEITRINKVAAASRLTAEEKRRSAERKVREKAERIRVTGKLPGACGCF